MTPQRAGIALVAAVAIACASVLRAHITVVSPYTFNKEVRPILERRCAGCHAESGIAPLPLLRYDDARMRTWPIRQTLISGRMPPWSGESGRAVLKEPPHALTARELDILMTWAAGGAPEGARTPEPGPPAALPKPAPDLIVQMREPFTLAADAAAADADVELASADLRGKWIRAVDVLPGTPSIVRSASVRIAGPAGGQVVGVWVPGDEPQPMEGGAAFQVPASAELRLTLHYQRPPANAAPMADRSAVAFYFANPSAARAAETIEIGPRPITLDRAADAVAFRPVDGPADARITAAIVSKRGRASLLRMQLRPEWPRRYVFSAPVRLERGDRIELAAEAWPVSLWRSLTADAERPAEGGPVRAALDVVR